MTFYALNVHETDAGPLAVLPAGLDVPPPDFIASVRPLTDDGYGIVVDRWWKVTATVPLDFPVSPGDTVLRLSRLTHIAEGKTTTMQGCGLSCSVYGLTVPVGIDRWHDVPLPPPGSPVGSQLTVECPRSCIGKPRRYGPDQRLCDCSNGRVTVDVWEIPT